VSTLFVVLLGLPITKNQKKKKKTWRHKDRPSCSHSFSFIVVISFLFISLSYFTVGDLPGLITILCSMKYVYLLQEREFVTRAENVYKVGRTTQINFTRFNQYPKSSKLYFQRYCGDCHICEREIIALLTERYDRRIDVGG
jgi:hypothetical protein